MRTFTLIQKQLNALKTAVIDTTVIGEFKTLDDATKFLQQRNYHYDEQSGAYFHGNATHYPVTVNRPPDYGVFDIRSFDRK